MSRAGRAWSNSFDREPSNNGKHHHKCLIPYIIVSRNDHNLNGVDLVSNARTGNSLAHAHALYPQQSWSPHQARTWYRPFACSYAVDCAWGGNLEISKTVTTIGSCQVPDRQQFVLLHRQSISRRRQTCQTPRSGQSSCQRGRPRSWNCLQKACFGASRKPCVMIRRHVSLPLGIFFKFPWHSLERQGSVERSRFQDLSINTRFSQRFRIVFRPQKPKRHCIQAMHHAECP